GKVGWVMRANGMWIARTLSAVAMTFGLVGCSGAPATGVDTSGAAATTAHPTSFADLKTLKSADLSDLFDQGSMGPEVFEGLYAGLPLCFPEEIPAPEAFPAGARQVQGFDSL